MKQIYKYGMACMFVGLALSSCRKEELDTSSVVSQYITQAKPTELDTWAEKTFAPYNLQILYRWQKSNLPVGSIATPPRVEQVRPVLEALKELWIDLYEEPKAGGAHFIKDKQLIRLTLLGGNELQSNGVLLHLWYPDTSSNELFLFDVNHFDPKSKSSVYKLMRSVHHQFARRLIESIPYDRDAFGTIGAQAYGSLALAPNKSLAARRIGFSPYAHRRGFYTLHSMFTPEEEFAEIISIMLLHSAVELYDAEQIAATPIFPDQPESVQEAKEAHRIMVAKRAFVEQYFKKEVGISLARLQLLSLKRLNLYYKKHQSQ